MKKFIAFLFCISTVSLVAQISHPEYEIGYFFDSNKQFIPGYVDFDYQVNNPISVSYTVGVNFTKGYYYDTLNVKHEGFIKDIYQSDKIRFKNNSGVESPVLSAKDCDGYVIGRDSFAVISNFTIERAFITTKAKYRDFALVIGRVGDLTFYKHTRINNSNVLDTYLVRKDGEDSFESFPQDSTHFRKIAHKYFDLTPDFKAKIDNGRFTKDDVPNLVKLLKYYSCFKTNSKIFFSRSWDEVDNPIGADKYATVEGIVNDSVFVLKHFFMDGTPISRQFITSIIPYKVVGETEYYYSNGAVRKIKSPNGKQTKLTYFYGDGTLMSEVFAKGKILPFSFKTGKLMVYDQDQGLRTVDILSQNSVKDSYYGLQAQTEDEKNGVATLKKNVSFETVRNKEGRNILDALGNGTLSFYDSIRGRQLEWQFSENKIQLAYFIDKDQRKVYQVCDKNAYLSSDKFDVKEKLEMDMHYQEYDFDCDAHGIALVRCVVETNGIVSDFELLKGVGKAYDMPINNFFAYAKMAPIFKPAVVNKKAVVQEIVLPIVFELKTYLPVYNYNNMWNNPNMFPANFAKPPIPVGLH